MGGSESPLAICGFSKLNIDPPEPFANLTADCHPTASKSRRYSQKDCAFIDEEVKRHRRTQVVVTKDENPKKRIAIHYLQMINRFTLLDAFPLPRISNMVNKIAQYRVFRTFDLELHIIKCCSRMKKRLKQPLKLKAVFNSCPMELKVADENDFEVSLPYLDNVTICGKDQKDHDQAAKCKNHCCNTQNCIFSTQRLPIWHTAKS